jgi:HPt (histidine-containing phosphotransfer) domain-containing protein
MNIQIPGINAKKGLDLFDDDVDIYLVVLRSWLTNTPAVLDKLRNVSAETLADYAISIHGIKGTSANIGAEEVIKAAVILENMAKNGDISGVLANNSAFLKLADVLVEDVRNWLAQYDKNN